MPKRSVFFVSDSSGITAEVIGHSLLPHFPDVEFERITLPFVNTVEKAQLALAAINRAAAASRERPVVISTLVDGAARAEINHAEALVLDFFSLFATPLEAELGVELTHVIGRLRGPGDYQDYMMRIEAVNYALSHDDGSMTRELASADIILVGVSRCGKTPTSLYLAMQYGVRAANYPIVPEDMGGTGLPALLKPFRSKLFGLTIEPERLAQIRAERKPDSRYASPDNCRFEVAEVEALLRREGVRTVDTTSKSVEEIASSVLHAAQLQRRIF